MLTSYEEILQAVTMTAPGAVKMPAVVSRILRIMEPLYGEESDQAKLESVFPATGPRGALLPLAASHSGNAG